MLAGTHCIDGRLLVGDGVDSFAGLESLQLVTGEVIIAGTTDLVDLSGLSSLLDVGALLLYDNEILMDLTGAASLQSAELIFVTNNPLLSTAEIEALAAGVKGASLEHCGNLDDGPCSSG